MTIILTTVATVRLECGPPCTFPLDPDGAAPGVTDTLYIESVCVRYRLGLPDMTA